MTQRTFIMLKPDALQRGIVGDIITRIERKNFRISALKLMELDDAILREHYEEHIGRPYWEKLYYYMLSGPVVVMVVEGVDVIAGMRRLMGPTGPENQLPGSVRGDYAVDVTLNVIHGSDSEETANAEIKRFFPEYKL